MFTKPRRRDRIMRSCPRCEALLGPWEDAACLSCLKRVVAGKVVIPDAAVRVLEHEKRAVGIHDIHRAIERDLRMSVAQTSVQVALSNDPRVCWGGKGLYGLFRHGLFPGPRNLAGPAMLLLYAYGKPIHITRLAFVMKRSGYRFQDTSLQIALSNERLPRWPVPSYCLVIKEESAERQLYRLGFAPSQAGFDRLVRYAQDVVRDGLEEFERRIGAET